MNTTLTPTISGYYIRETVKGYEVTRATDNTCIELHRTFREARKGLAIAAVGKWQRDTGDYSWSTHQRVRDGVLRAVEACSDDFTCAVYREQQRKQYGKSPAPAL